MDFHHFIGQIQDRARLGTTQAAVNATHATLSTLGERLTEGERKDLAAQLPQEVGHYLIEGDSGQTFDIDAYFSRISAREHSDVQDAVYHSRVVLEVLQEAVSPGEIRQIKDQLPPEFYSVFESGSSGKLKP